MFLILGNPQDPCCLGVHTELEGRNFETRIIENPIAHPSHFAWWLNNDRSVSQVAWEQETIFDNHVSGVLVRTSGWIDPGGWEPKDLAYMQAETQAALLAWLWSLDCPVVNRYPPSVWYRPQIPLLFWIPLLRRCGLPTQEILVTNVEQEAEFFGLTDEETTAVVYGPLTSPMHYLVTGAEDWSGLAAMQRYTPVSLTHPHGAVQFVCVVGGQVVWEGEPSSEMAALESELRQFALAAGLTFVELGFAPTSKGICVIDVEPQPHLERFGEAARQLIVDGIVNLLTARIDNARAIATRSVQRRK